MKFLKNETIYDRIYDYVHLALYLIYPDLYLYLYYRLKPAGIFRLTFRV